jgi:hypothetical protein
MLLKYKPGLVDELKRKGFRFLILMKEKSRLTVVPTTDPIPRDKLTLLETMQLKIDDRDLLEFLTAISSNKQMDVKVQTNAARSRTLRMLTAGHP